MTTGGEPDRWSRIEEVLAGALKREPSDRDAYIDAACGGDTELRHEVTSLLLAHESSGAVDRLVAELAPLASQLRGTTASLVGRVIGRYEILEQVGGGGMGVVYKARDSRLDRTVALKFLQPRFDADDTAIRRFRLEARAVAAMDHPNICTLHETGETDDGQLFLAMPLYNGETLQQLIARGPLPVGEAVTIAVQIARGLAKAHSHGIVHRDIKPSNVLVTDDGLVKVLDFGIARLSDVTATGTTGPVGTAAYMSPEQAQGKPVDHRSDLWSLGVILYEMLTGTRPFPEGLATDVPGGIQRSAPVPLATHRGDVPAAIERIISELLATSVEERYQSARVVESDLLAWKFRSGETPGLTAFVRKIQRSTSKRRVRRIIAAAGGTAVVLVTAALLLQPATNRGVALNGVASSPAIAVLPFTDRSPLRDQENFSDGLTEELITRLAGVENLRVTSRTSAFAFKDRNLDVRTVGAQLGVSMVLEGIVRRAGDRLRISVQLVSAADGYQLWSETYDRKAGDGFAIQQEIASVIVQTLRARLFVEPGFETP